MSLRSNNQKERQKPQLGNGEKLGGGKWGNLGKRETTGQAKHEIKMRLRCILNCHDADDARSGPGKGVTPASRRSAYNFIFHTQLSSTKCEGRRPKARILLGSLPFAYSSQKGKAKIC